MEQMMIIFTAAVLLHVTTDAFPYVADPDEVILNSLFAGDVVSKRVAPDSPRDSWLRSETNRQYDDTLVNLDRRGGGWSSPGNSGRWSGSNKITPYYTYNPDGINYKSNTFTQPNSWYGRGWYRVLSRSNPKYRVGRRSRIQGPVYDVY